MTIFSKLFNRKKKQDTIFQPWIDAGYRYESKPVYLGREQALVSPDGNCRIFWTCSARDGIYMQIKRFQPWHILFDYTDGGVVINDDSEEMKTILKEIKEELDQLRSKSRETPSASLQKELDEIVLRNLERTTGRL